MEARGYIVDDFVREAKRRGFTDISRRLVYDWGNLGLLAAPSWPGRGRGNKSRWPEEQLQLFISILEKRKEVMHIPILCNLPVWLWLYWGDKYAGLPQVKRALNTWGRAVLRSWGRASTGSWVSARKGARRLLDQLIFPSTGVRGERRLLKSLTEMIYRRSIDHEALLPLVTEALSGAHKMKAEGPAAHIFTAENIVLQIVSRHDGIVHLNEFGDGVFEWARRFINIGNQQYRKEQPRLASDQHSGHLFSVRDVNETANRACADLVETLGMTHLNRVKASTKSVDDPSIWDSLNLRRDEDGIVRTPGGVILPVR